ncbi:hypothetical protein BX265_4978 [Streptomyces sp. TLI_235]|nr:hypothetical protein [Streptomyces sp. TLI_235]PBC80142.1 hypothetical protein BX265_4978 [Streptomyces sp. TLI_235]
MSDTVRPAPGAANPTVDPAVIVTIALDVPLTLVRPHPVHSRIDTVVRAGDTVSVITGTPAATPVPARLPDGVEAIAAVHLGPMATGLQQQQIRPLNACCVCGAVRPHGRRFYENVYGHLFCWPCADGNRPACPAGDDCRGTDCERKAEHGPRPDPLCVCHEPPAPMSEHGDPAPADVDPPVTGLTDEQRDALLEAAARVGAEFAKVVQALMPAVQAAAEQLAQLGQALQSAGLLATDCKPVHRRDRPAWQSPYGPPSRRR